MVAWVVREADQAHGRVLPSGRAVAKTLRQIFRRQLAQVWSVVSDGERPAPKLDHWTGQMVDTLTPQFQPYFENGAREAVRRIRRQAKRRGRRDFEGWVRAPASRVPLNIGFDVFNPRVLEAIKRLVFDFCVETNKTSKLRTDQAIAAFRDELSVGVSKGEALERLQLRVQRVFADVSRAHTIAMTETSRVMHTGQLFVDQESGLVTGKEWLASSDACDKCLALNGVVVPLNEPFIVDGVGTYAQVMVPPRHPHCMCTYTEVF